MSKLIIKNGRIITPQKVLDGASVLIDNGKITAIGKDIEAVEAGTIDAEGAFVSPGFIDIHTHGAGGADYMDGTKEAYLVAARANAIHGCTLLFPTTVACSNEDLFASFETFTSAKESNVDGAILEGLHLEGPYFSPENAGAQDRKFIRNPEPSDYLEIIRRGKGIIRRWSFAPELEGAAEFAATISKEGIIASAAHTGASFYECDTAFKNGCSLLTHFFNCMSTIRKEGPYKHAGVLEYGYYQDDMFVEIIADGIHVPQELLCMILKIKGSDHIALITDAMRAAGMPEGRYIIGSIKNGREIIVEDGVGKLPDRMHLASSVATTDRLVRTILNMTGCSIVDAVKMASTTPARVMKIDDRKGSISVGKDADIVIFDENINIRSTIIGGRKIYQA